VIYQQARDIAERLADRIRPGCDRLEIVGSVKRADKAECHDIEMLVIANEKAPRPVFGQKIIHHTMLDMVLYELCESGTLKFVKGKDRLRQYAIVEARTVNPFKLELYIVRPETWGIQNVIRTGPSLFSHRFVTNRSATCFVRETGQTWRGLLPDEFKYVRGETKIMRGTDVLSLPEEADAIALLGMGWIGPKNRRNIALRN
jgi:hypothetical protein